MIHTQHPRDTLVLMHHHALVFEGEREPAYEKAKAHIEQVLLLPFHNNPDVHVERFGRLAIDDVRTLTERAQLTPFGTTHVFVIVADTILREAQNALLKLLEEPPKDTVLLFVLPNVMGLLPTVRSRVALAGRGVGMPEEHEFAMQFLAAPPTERLSSLRPILDRDGKVDRTRARSLVDALEHILHGNAASHAAALREIVFVRTFLPDQSSSVKMLLEHLAATLPRVQLT